MREILFRGKRTDNGEWVYGGYLQQEEYSLIMVWYLDDFKWNEWLVIPESIGQYTGLTDKNGTKIFEGDIITTSTGRKCLVVWFHSIQYCGWDLKPIEWEHTAPKLWDLYESENLEVIGTIYDNPELLEELK